MVNGLRLYSAFMQSAVQFMPLIHPFTHRRRLAAVRGTNRLVGSDRGLGVPLGGTSTRPGRDRTRRPLPCHSAPPGISGPVAGALCSSPRSHRIKSSRPKGSQTCPSRPCSHRGGIIRRLIPRARKLFRVFNLGSFELFRQDFFRIGRTLVMRINPRSSRLSVLREKSRVLSMTYGVI